MLRIFYFLLISIFVSTNLFSQDFECSDCHDDVPIKGAHEDMLACDDCHSDVVDEEHADSGVKKVDCISCHDQKYLSTTNSDIHRRLKGVVKNPPTCLTCHGSHTIISPSDYKNPTRKICGSCHKADKIVFPSKYHVRSKSAATCYECHEEEEYQPELSTSVHNNLNCADCHNYVTNNIDSHPDGLTPKQTANCYACHNDVAKIHEESIHGISLASGIEDAAMCWDCHGSHKIVPTSNSESLVNSKNIGNTCGSCHDDPKFEERHHMSIKLPGQMYSTSVHGKVLANGELEGASCVSCHGDHDIKNRVQSGSRIAVINLPNTCADCHSDIVEEYKNSIHWMRVQKGIKEAPVCNDCHSEHSISLINDGHKKENLIQMQEETCIRCHSSESMNQKFGNSGLEANQYLNSYHGLAVMRGGNNAALCIDCHGVHSIWPKSNPSSTVNPNNVTTTCQKCHTGASETFSKSYSHQTESEQAQKIEGLVGTIYFWLIVGVIGGMFIHNLIIFAYELRRRRRTSKNVIRLPRFTKNEVVQHFLLLLSFIILAITGFALKYPNSFWAEGLLTMGMTEPVRQNIHRISAVVMIVLSLYHVIYLLATARGRDVLKEMFPSLDDFRGVVDNMMYYLRLSKKHPHFNQYNYIEKAEYWALIWGTFVMGLTGFILWFPTIIGDWAPIWLIKVSEIIHFYEAILASLAILVWHWFFVIFHPREYPMSFTWIDGQISLEEYRRHHENQFRKLILDWYDFKTEKKEKKKLSNYTQLFMKTLEKHGFEPGEVFQNELNHDPELTVWFDNEIAKREK